MRKRTERNAAPAAPAPETQQPVAPTGHEGIADRADGTPAFHRETNRHPDEPSIAMQAPELAPGYGRIVETMFRVDRPDVSYERLKRELTFNEDQGDWRTDYGSMMNALNQAEQNAQEAMELLANAKITLTVYEIDADVFTGAMREKAMTQLQQEKKQGERSKAITNDDVDMCAAMLFPDQWRNAGRGRAEQKEIVRVIESLAERWKERHRALRVMLQTMRGAG